MGGLSLIKASAGNISQSGQGIIPEVTYTCHYDSQLMWGGILGYHINTRNMSRANSNPTFHVSFFVMKMTPMCYVNGLHEFVPRLSWTKKTAAPGLATQVRWSLLRNGGNSLTIDNKLDGDNVEYLCWQAVPCQPAYVPFGSSDNGKLRLSHWLEGEMVGPKHTSCIQGWEKVSLMINCKVDKWEEHSKCNGPLWLRN